MSTVKKIQNIFKIFAVMCLALVLLWMPGRALAQENLSFSSLEIDLWPEFDQPTVLVIYRITLSSQVKLPADLSLRIPAAVGAPNAVAVKQPDGSLFNLPYTQQDAGDGWSQILFSATAPDLQIEYYDPGLVKEGAARHYEYHWPGDYAVEALSIEVQQPVGATEMKISPSLGNGDSSTGIVYYRQQIGALAGGQTFEITFDYQKDTDDLSAGSMPVQPGGPLNDTTTGRLTFAAALPWALGAIGVLLIAGGGFWYWQSGRKGGSTKDARRARPRGPGKKEELEASENSNIYCHQCGKRASAGDRFCRACGTQLRVS